MCLLRAECLVTYGVNYTRKPNPAMRLRQTDMAGNGQAASQELLQGRSLGWL